MRLRWVSLAAMVLPAASLGAAALTQTIAQKYDAYVKATTAVSPARDRLAREDYLKWFSPYQTRDAIRGATTDNLRLLFGAADMAAFYAPMTGDGKRFTDDMARDLAELERRHAERPQNYSDMYADLALNREYSAARAFYDAHKIMDYPPLPGIQINSSRVGAGLPTELAVSTKEKELVRRRVPIEKGPVIVAFVDPECHFCEAFLKDMRAQPKLLSMISKHSVWITPIDGIFQLETLQQWNRAHPDQSLGVVYRYSEWPMIKAVALPTFYFLHDGKVVTTIVGWPKGGNVPALQVALMKIGLPVASATP